MPATIRSSSTAMPSAWRSTSILRARSSLATATSSWSRSRSPPSLPELARLGLFRGSHGPRTELATFRSPRLQSTTRRLRQESSPGPS